MKNELKKILEDGLVREVLEFFYRNQASVDSVGGISAWVHSDREKVHSALDKLVRIGVLEKDSMGSTRGYSYTHDEEIMKIVEGLLSDE